MAQRRRARPAGDLDDADRFELFVRNGTEPGFPSGVLRQFDSLFGGAVVEFVGNDQYPAFSAVNEVRNTAVGVVLQDLSDRQAAVRPCAAL